MSMRAVWCAVLIVVLSAALGEPAAAESIQTAGDQLIAGIVIVAVGAAMLTTFLILHHQRNKQRTITGCVSSVANGMSLKDEKDQKVYTLSGDATGMKSGERMTIEGRRKNTLVFDVQKVTKDFGVCKI